MEGLKTHLGEERNDIRLSKLRLQGLQREPYLLRESLECSN